VAHPELYRFRRSAGREILGEDVGELQARSSIVVARQPSLVDTPVAYRLLETDCLNVRQRILSRSDE
jgi:hypothetical protein